MILKVKKVIATGGRSSGLNVSRPTHASSTCPSQWLPSEGMLMANLLVQGPSRRPRRQHFARRLFRANEIGLYRREFLPAGAWDVVAGPVPPNIICRNEELQAAPVPSCSMARLLPPLRTQEVEGAGRGDAERRRAEGPAAVWPADAR